jgi:hypothetical protein
MSSVWELDEFKSYAQTFRDRNAVFATRFAYYEGTAYQYLKLLQRPLGSRVYKGIKGLYLPLHRAVDVAAGITPGGWAWPEGMDEKLALAAKTVFNWSRWNTEGVLFVHYGALFGNVLLKVADLRDEKIVVIDPVSPNEVLLVSSGAYDATPKLAITVCQRGSGPEAYEYAEVIDPEKVRTFKNGDPFGYDDRQPEYPNELKFVPFVEVQHKRVGRTLGENVFARVLPLLDEVNELASYLADIIKKHVEPQWAAIGAEPAELEKSGESLWFFPEGSDVKALVAQLDIAGVLAFLQDVKDEMKSGLPELAFDELRSKDQIATATVELQLMELTLKVKRTRPNYDAGLVGALRMAGRAAATLGIDEVSVLDDPTLAFDPDRPVLPLDPMTKMQLEMQGLALENEKALMTKEGKSADNA